MDDRHALSCLLLTKTMDVCVYVCVFLLVSRNSMVE
jgi:hypothetical protein